MTPASGVDRHRQAHLAAEGSRPEGWKGAVDRAKGSNNLAANIFLHFKKVLEDFDLVKTVGTSKIVMEPALVAAVQGIW